MARGKQTFREKWGGAISRGAESHPAWATGPRAKGTGRHTWYVAVRVRQDVAGNVSDLTLSDVDDRQRTRVVTVALLGTVKAGPNAGTLRRLTRQELEADFDGLLERAIKRHGLIPSGPLRNAVRAVYRHKDA